ncbi:hypothetical protein ACOSQ4_026722 [Xanthoceras sorbifolium]
MCASSPSKARPSGAPHRHSTSSQAERNKWKLQDVGGRPTPVHPNEVTGSAVVRPEEVLNPNFKESSALVRSDARPVDKGKAKIVGDIQDSQRLCRKNIGSDQGDLHGLVNVGNKLNQVSEGASLQENGPGQTNVDLGFEGAGLGSEDALLLKLLHFLLLPAAAAMFSSSSKSSSCYPTISSLFSSSCCCPQPLVPALSPRPRCIGPAAAACVEPSSKLSSA